MLWGAWVVFWPEVSLRWFGYPEPISYPELWQCIGMIVGVYGIGYWLAASDPFRHWPIVFVGWLGKIFGPLGFLFGYLQGRLPLSAGVVNIFNDLIWWIPFTLILWRALRYEQIRRTTSEQVLGFPEAIQTFRSQHGETLAELSHRGQLLVLFLRHSGCTFCREALHEIQQTRAELEQQGVGIAFVHMEPDPVRAEQLFATYEVQDLPRFCDPEQVLYRAFEIGVGRFRQLMSLRVLWRGYQAAIAKGHGFAGIRGNVFRLPGTFLLENGVIVRRHTPRDAADHPDYLNFACPLDPTRASTI